MSTQNNNTQNNNYEIFPEFPICDKVKKLMEIPQYEQRTPEWYAQRKGALTASDVPAALGNNKYKSQWQLLLDKCGEGKPFTGNDATRWGNLYEDVAIEKYSQLRNKKVYSFGLLIHPEYKWLGGSPDGITSDGILLEVKCPMTRKIIPGEVPHHYIAQVLLNMEICNLDIAHFIEFIPGKSDDDYEINIVEVKRDREWFQESLPIMREFWDSVEKYRKIGISKHPKYKPSKRTKITDSANSITLNIDYIKSEKKKNECFFLED